MKCAIKSQKPWLSLGEEGMGVQLNRVTDGCSELVGIQLHSLSGGYFGGNSSLGVMGSWQEVAPT